METEERHSPEEYLEAAKAEGVQNAKGRLKIFLGMAAGVGKTYAMLEEAHTLKDDGVNVCIGVVETHGREETAELLNGLTVIPPKIINYRDHEFKELDLESIIHLHPDVVLVDELAHTNTPGSQHAKRWNDVLEILDNGIDVYTTLNVQHIETLNDIVRSITDVQTQETVPDLVIEKASSIRLIDLTPDELLQRLKDGKVYIADQTQVAIDHFFRKERLTALREIVLRYAADKIDLDLRKMKTTQEGMIEWKPREKFLVAINESHDAQKLIRTTRRLAATMGAPWIAVYVDDGSKLDANENSQLSKNLDLARELGADVIILNDYNVAEGIKRFAYQRGVTQIMLGRPPKNPFWDFFKPASLLDQLSSTCKDIDIHVFRQEKHKVSYRKKIRLFEWKQSLNEYIYILILITLLTICNWFVVPYIGYKIVGVVFLLAILSHSLFFKKGPIIFASALYALIWDFVFIPPLGSLVIHSYEDIALVILYGLTALIIGVLADREREHKELLAKSEMTATTLYDIARNLTGNQTIEEILDYTKERLKRIFDGTYEFMIKKVDDGLILNDPHNLLSNEKEKNAAMWTFENGQEAGWSTETLPSVQNLYLPLKGIHEMTGILIFKPKSSRVITLEEKNMLYTVCQHISQYLERSFTLEREKQHDHLKDMEKMHKKILDRFSVAFERPIQITRNNIQKLKEQLKLSVDKKANADIIELENSFEVFTKLITNITAMAQLSESMIPLKKSSHFLKEIIYECCENLNRANVTNEIQVKIQGKLPPINVDFYLVQILLYNLILNAVENSPNNTPVHIEAKKRENWLILSVADEGTGIPEDELEMIFEKFYRREDEKSTGIGLGLAIARTIAELHHGTLKVENLPVRGAKFTLTLPFEVV